MNKRWKWIELLIPQPQVDVSLEDRKTVFCKETAEESGSCCMLCRLEEVTNTSAINAPHTSCHKGCPI